MRIANEAKCMKVNTPILEEILQLRQEQAKLLGYEDHAAYELEIKMAKNSKIVYDFLNGTLIFVMAVNLIARSHSKIGQTCQS